MGIEIIKPDHLNLIFRTYNNNINSLGKNTRSKYKSEFRISYFESSKVNVIFLFYYASYCEYIVSFLLTTNMEKSDAIRIINYMSLKKNHKNNR